MKKKTLIGDRKEGGFKADREFDCMNKALKEKKTKQNSLFPLGTVIKCLLFHYTKFPFRNLATTMASP